MSDGPFILRALEVAVRRIVDRIDGQPHCVSCRNALHDIANEIEKIEGEWSAAKRAGRGCPLNASASADRPSSAVNDDAGDV